MAGKIFIPAKPVKPFNPTKKYNPTVATRVTNLMRDHIEESVAACGVTMTMWLQAAIEDKLEKEKPRVGAYSAAPAQTAGE